MAVSIWCDVDAAVANTGMEITAVCLIVSVSSCSDVVIDHGAMGCRIDPPWGGPTQLILVPASAPRPVRCRCSCGEHWYGDNCGMSHRVS